MKIPGINGLRGLIALIIVAYHLNQSRPTQNLSEFNWHIYQFTEMLPVVVAVFFILSGFLCSLKYWQYIFLGRELPNLKKVILDRFYRIAPLYYFALFISLLLAFILNIEVHNLVLKLISGLTFTSWIHPFTFFPAENNGPLWFVSYDMIGYVFVACFMSFLVRIRKGLIPISYIILLGVLLLLHFVFISIPFPHGEGIVSVWFPYYNPFIFGIYFFCGSMICGLYIKFHDLLINKQIWFDIGSLIVLFFICLLLWNWKGSTDLAHSYPLSPYRFPIMMILWSIYIYFLILSRYVSQLFDNRIFVFLGMISYPLYLFHSLVMQTFLSYFPLNNHFQNWVAFSIFTIISSVILSYLLLRYIEKPIKSFLQKILTQGG